MSMIKNASPQVINLGADDKSIRALKPESEPIPQHLPLFFTFAKKGTSKRVLTGGAKLPLLYGEDTFNVNGNYFNHQTRLLTKIAGTGNTCLVQRLIPTDSGVKASCNLYVDVLETTVPNYQRNSTGDYVIDSVTNQPKVDTVTPSIPGYKIKFIKENNVGVYTDVKEFGLLTSKAGTMHDGATTSTMYPILEFIAAEHGDAYNNMGFTISSLYNDNADSKIMQKTKGLSYKLGLVTRETRDATPTVFRSLYGEPNVQFSLINKAINPNTETRFDLEQVFNTQFFNETDPLKSLKYNDYEGIKVYRNNLELVYGLLMAKEADHITYTDTVWKDGITSDTMAWFDFTTDVEADLLANEKYLLNIFSCKSSKNINYFTFMLDKTVPSLTGTQAEVAISASTPIWMSGGSDGTLSNTQFEDAVKREMAKYIDNDSEYMDTAINVESIIYDTGFELETKKSLFNFIALRKDTVVILSVHSGSKGEKYATTSDQRAIGVVLRTRANLAPESEYYGTGVCRALIVMGTGLLRDGSSANRIPLTYEIGYKAARMMGAGNGKWKPEYIFDRDPANKITELIDIEPKFLPNGIKPTLWADGLVWAQPADRQEFAFLQLQTVYDNDTSILNNFFNVMALATVSKVGEDAWRKFSGSTALSDGEFIDEVTNYVTAQLKDRFAGMLVCIPVVSIDEMDELRGYSWHLVNKLYGNNMKTVMTYTTEVYRASDLNA